MIDFLKMKKQKAYKTRIIKNIYETENNRKIVKMFHCENSIMQIPKMFLSKIIKLKRKEKSC